MGARRACQGEQQVAHESGAHRAELEKQPSQSAAGGKQQVTENFHALNRRRRSRQTKPRQTGSKRRRAAQRRGTRALAAGARRTEWPMRQGTAGRARIRQAHRGTEKQLSQSAAEANSGRNLRTQQAATVAANKQAEADRQQAQARHAQLEQELAALQQVRAELMAMRRSSRPQESRKHIAELEKQLSQSAAE